MPADDKSAAALRALLAGESERHKELIRELDSAESNDFLDLVAAAFVGITDITFGEEADAAASVTTWVARIGSESEFPDGAFNPVIAEQVLLMVLGKADADDLSPRQLQDAQFLLLPVLVHDAGLADGDIDDFLEAARSLLDD